MSPIKEMYEELELPRQRHDTAMDAAQKAGQPEPAPPEGMDTRSSQQMQNDVDAVVAKLELSANTNKGVLDQYNRRKEEVSLRFCRSMSVECSSGLSDRQPVADY